MTSLEEFSFELEIRIDHGGRLLAKPDHVISFQTDFILFSADRLWLFYLSSCFVSLNKNSCIRSRQK